MYMTFHIDIGGGYVDIETFYGVDKFNWSSA
jgi:hypothetical protein